MDEYFLLFAAAQLRNIFLDDMFKKKLTYKVFIVLPNWSPFMTQNDKNFLANFFHCISTISINVTLNVEVFGCID